MRNRARTIDGRGNEIPDFTYEVQGMDSRPSRLSGYMSIRAFTGKEVFRWQQLANREEVISYLDRVEASGEFRRVHKAPAYG